MKVFNQDVFFRTLIFLFFVAPYFIFFYYFRFAPNFNLDELLWALKNSILQSATAATFVLLMAIPMSQGIWALPKLVQGFLKKALLVPYILPTLFSILVAFSVIQPFPMGSMGVIILFIIINLGFVTVVLHDAATQKLAHVSMISELYSLSKLQFYSKIYLPTLKSDLLLCFFMVFIFCISSFSVPLIVGGGKGTNLEVLIYEKIFIEQNIAAAFSVCLVQALMVFILSYFFLKNKKSTPNMVFNRNYLKSYVGAFLIIVYLFVYFAGYVQGLWHSISYVDFVAQYFSEILDATVFTTRTFLSYLIMNFILLIVWVVHYVKFKKFYLASNLLYFSTAMLGFSLYLFLPVRENYDAFKIVYASCVLFFPMLFKLFLQKPIEEMKHQIQIAQVFGLSDIKIVFKVILMQMKRPLATWGAFLAIWFISEYALLKSLGMQNKTLGLLTEGFLSSYRLQAAYLLSLYILIYWILLLTIGYIFFKVTYVLYKKFIY